MKISLKTQVDNTLEVLNNLESLEGMDVLVGIPEEASQRIKGEVTNAQLVEIHTKGLAQNLYWESKGSPLQKLPARPIIEPALGASGNKERIVEDLKIVGELLLDGKRDEAIKALHIAGLDGVNMIKAWFDDPRNGWAPNSPATIKRKGSNKVLIDTAQMRNAMTYVVDIKGK